MKFVQVQQQVYEPAYSTLKINDNSNEIYYIRRQTLQRTIRTEQQAATQDISLALYNSTQRTA